MEEVDSVQVDIFDARQQTDIAWQTQGFELTSHVCGSVDWNNDPQVATDYYPSMEALARDLAGCDHALIAGHIHRNPTAAAQHSDFAPIQYAHSDFTESYGDLIRHRYAESEPDTQATLERANIGQEDVLNARRILILQFWRNIGSPNMDLPLAFCDARTVQAEDLVAYHIPEYGGEVSSFDTFGVTRPAIDGAHKWFVYPEMTPDEVIAFRTFDSDMVETKQHFWTPHSAFVDPTVRAPYARHSIEVRATCLFH